MDKVNITNESLRFSFKKVEKELCPYLDEPFDDCHCMKLTSQDIEKTIYLCSQHFEYCEIYSLRHQNGNGKGYMPIENCL